MPEPTKAKDPATSQDDDKTPKGPDAEGDKGTQTKTEDKTFTQADQDALAAKVRREEKEKYERERDKAKREAEEAKAKEQGEFQKLAEGYKQELDELKPKHEAMSAEHQRLTTTVADIASAELKALPEQVRDVSPAQYGDDKALTNPLDVLAWLPKGKALAALVEGTPAKPGLKDGPKPTGQTPAQVVEEIKRRKLSSGQYTSIG